MQHVQFCREEMQTHMEFPPDYHAGHFVLIGPTGSGKTYYAKYILKGRLETDPSLPVFVFVADISAHDWLDPEESGRSLVPAENVSTEWSRERLDTMYETLRAERKGLVVLDDFKSKVDFHTNKEFKEMFRVFRHLGTQVLAIGHTPSDVPPVVRDSVTHCILTFTNNRDVVKDLAQTYLAGDVSRLRDVIGRLRGRSVVKINARANTIEVHSAPEGCVRTSSIGTDAGGGPAGALDLKIGGPSLTGATVNAQARGAVSVNGTYNDASTNTQYLRLQENLAAQQRMSVVALQDMRNRAKVSQEIEIAREEHLSRLQCMRENQEAYDLLHRHLLNAEERQRLASILAKRLGDASISPYTYQSRGADREFMAIYFPREPYTPPDKSLQTCGALVPQLVRGEYKALAGELALSAIAAPSTTAGGVVGAAVGALRGLRGAIFGPKEEEDPLPSGRLARRQEIRRLVLLLADKRATDAERARLITLLGSVYAEGPVTAENHVKIALRFLHAYYPADFEVLAGRRRGVKL